MRGVVVLVDAGSCVERGDRFRLVEELLRSVVCGDVREGLDWVSVILWWGGGCTPLYIGVGECSVVDAVGIIGGRGCWDACIYDALKLVGPGRAALLVVGCCRGPCSRHVALPEVFEWRGYLCVDGVSSKLLRLLEPLGFNVVSSRIDAVVEGLRGWLYGEVH